MNDQFQWHSRALHHHPAHAVNTAYMLVCLHRVLSCNSLSPNIAIYLNSTDLYHYKIHKLLSILIIYRFYYFLHHYICFVLFYCVFLFVLLLIAVISLLCLCAFVTLNKRLLTYFLNKKSNKERFHRLEYFYYAMCCASANVSPPDVSAVAIVWRSQDKTENYWNHSLLYCVP